MRTIEYHLKHSTVRTLGLGLEGEWAAQQIPRSSAQEDERETAVQGCRRMARSLWAFRRVTADEGATQEGLKPVGALSGMNQGGDNAGGHKRDKRQLPARDYTSVRRDQSPFWAEAKTHAEKEAGARCWGRGQYLVPATQPRTTAAITSRLRRRKDQIGPTHSIQKFRTVGLWYIVPSRNWRWR